MSQISNILNNLKSEIISQIDKLDNSIANSNSIRERMKEFEFVLSSELREYRLGIRSGIYEISCMNNLSFRELYYQMTLINHILYDEINQNFLDSLDELSGERRENAINAYINGRIEEAEKDLLIVAAINQQDFIVYHILGNICFYHNNNYDNAINYYQNAAKYAESYSAHHAVESLVSATLVYERINNIKLSEEVIQKSRSLLDDSAWVNYHYCRIHALKGNIEEFTSSLLRCINNDEMYLVAAYIDPSLAHMKNEIRSLSNDLCQKEDKKLTDIMNKIEKAQILVGEDATTERKMDITNNKVTTLRNNGSYLNVYKARKVAESALGDLKSRWIASKEDDIADYEKYCNKIKGGCTHYGWGCIPTVIIWFLIFISISSMYTFEPEMRGPVDVLQITYRDGIFIYLNGERTRTYPRGHLFEVLKNEGDILCLSEPKEGWRYCWEGTGRNQLLEWGAIRGGEIPDYSRTLGGWQIFFLFIIAPFGIWFISAFVIRYYRCEIADQKLSKAREQLRKLEKLVNL